VKALVQSVEAILGHALKDANPLKQALTHSSYANEQVGQNLQDNERLEFLGDAVLELLITDMLIAVFPEKQEGVLTKYRSNLVNETTLAEVAASIKLQDHLMLGKGESAQRDHLGASILSDAFEAFVAAIYVSEGFKATQDLVLHFMQPWIDRVERESFHPDFKSSLQELTLKLYKVTPKYRIIKEEGPAHDKSFVSEVTLKKEVLGQGAGPSKKLAEASAAQKALHVLELRKEVEVS